MTSKTRIDLALVQKGLFASREKAACAVKRGAVKVNGLVLTRSSAKIAGTDLIEIEKEKILTYVSLGGLKLEKALNEFCINPSGKNVLDAGASTGGFTDCLLKQGAAKVYAVDVGTGQIDPSISGDPRVVSIENQDIRKLQKHQVDNLIFDIITADLSFISLTLVIPHLCSLLKEDGFIIFLIKPQFEVGRENVGKNGIVKNTATIIYAIREIEQTGILNGLFMNRLTFAPILDPAKNIEFLGLFEKNEKRKPDINNIVGEAFHLLKSLRNC